MEKEVQTIIEGFSDDEQQLIQLLSEVVDIAGEIYDKQNNPDFPGGNLYPDDMTREEFDQAAIRDPEMKRFDTVVERVGSGSDFKAVPYNKKYSEDYAKIIDLLKKAQHLSPDPSFRVYMSALLTCLDEGTPEAYRHMTGAWVKTKDYHINFVFTYDERYVDRLVGLKGVFNTILFVEDKEMTPRIMKPVRVMSEFIEHLNLPGDPAKPSSISPAVFYTVAEDGLAKNFSARAWNVPDDPICQAEVGTRQMIVRKVALDLLTEQLWPIGGDVLDCQDEFDEDTFRDGFFWTITLHEICHNVGTYACKDNLEKYAPVFGELKSYVIPIYWMFYCQDKKVFSEKEVKASIYSYLAYSLSIAVLGEKFKERECYLTATLILLNYLVEKEAIAIDGSKMSIDLEKLKIIIVEFYLEIINIMEKCSYNMAKEFTEKYSDRDKFEKAFEIARKYAKL